MDLRIIEGLASISLPDLEVPYSLPSTRKKPYSKIQLVSVRNVEHVRTWEISGHLGSHSVILSTQQSVATSKNRTSPDLFVTIKSCFSKVNVLFVL